MSRNVRTSAFLQLFARLDPHVQEAAKKAFQLFQKDSKHISLDYHQLDDVHLSPRSVPPNRFKIFGVRVTRSHPAVAVRDSARDTNIWSFIGNHDAYMARSKRGSTVSLPPTK